MLRPFGVRVIVFLMVGSLMGCTSYYPVRDLSYAALIKEVHDGDHVVVTFKNGGKLGLKKVTVTNGGLEGQASDGTRRHVDLNDVLEISVRDVNPGATTVVVLICGAAVAVFVAILRGGIPI